MFNRLQTKKRTFTVISADEVAKILSATGLKRTWPTLRPWPERVSVGVLMLSFNPSLGIVQTIAYHQKILLLIYGTASIFSKCSESQGTLQSSLALAIILSLKGLKSVSSTAAACPLNTGRLSGSFPKVEVVDIR